MTRPCLLYQHAISLLALCRTKDLMVGLVYSTCMPSLSCRIELKIKEMINPV